MFKKLRSNWDFAKKSLSTKNFGHNSKRRKSKKFRLKLFQGMQPHGCSISRFRIHSTIWHSHNLNSVSKLAINFVVETDENTKCNLHSSRLGCHNAIEGVFKNQNLVIWHWFGWKAFGAQQKHVWRRFAVFYRKHMIEFTCLNQKTSKFFSGNIKHVKYDGK